jgi:hypothetical protein
MTEVTAHYSVKQAVDETDHARYIPAIDEGARLDRDPTHEPVMDRLLAQDEDDLAPGELEASRKKSRINALILGIVFLLLVVAPHPWNSLVPILLLIPLIYSLVNRVRGASRSSGPSPSPAPGSSDSRREPYSHTPSDPNDPRKYKPIG